MRLAENKAFYVQVGIYAFAQSRAMTSPNGLAVPFGMESRGFLRLKGWVRAEKVSTRIMGISKYKSDCL